MIVIVAPCSPSSSSDAPSLKTVFVRGAVAPSIPESPEGIIEALWKAHRENMSLRGMDATLDHPYYADHKLPQPRFDLIPDAKDPPF